MRKITKYTIAVGCAILLFACKKERDFPTWETDLLTPVIHTQLGLKNLVNDSLFIEDPDSCMKLLYETTLYELDLDSLLNVPDTTFSYAYPPFVFPQFHLDSAAVLMNTLGQSEFNMGEIKLTEAKVKEGFIKVETQNGFKQKINVIYDIPSATLGGAPFHVVEQVPAATGSGPTYFSKIYSLAGYDVDFTGAFGDEFNTIALQVIATADDSVTFYAADSVVFTNTYFDIVPSYARGYLGKDTFQVGPDQIDLDLFKNIPSGSLMLQYANLELQVDNYIGMDARFSIDAVNSINTVTTNTLSLANVIIGAQNNLNRGQETGVSGNPVIPSVWTHSLDETNSNIVQLIENLPTNFGYALSVETNPLGNVSGFNDFLYSDSTIEAKLKLEVPLSISTSGFTLRDTLDLNLNVGDIDNYLGGKFNLIAINNFPFAAKVQLYMIDPLSGLVNDSLLYGNNTIASGVGVDANTTATKTVLEVPMSKEKLQQLEKTQQLIVSMRYDTYNAPSFVKLYSNHNIDLTLTADFRYNVDLE